MTERFAEEMIFLAPRSHESAYDNLKSTIEHGIPYSRVSAFLDSRGQQILSGYPNVYAWGNVKDKKASWDLMQPGDLVLFYAKKRFIFSGRCLYKQLSEELSDALWPRTPRNKNKPWSCVFFLHDIRPIDIPLEEINDLCGYNFKALMGFQPLKQEGLEEIKNKYGSIENFLSAFQKGVSSDGMAVINKIAATDKVTNEQLAELDRVAGERDIEEVIAEWKARNLDKQPEEVDGRVRRIKRSYGLVRALKEKHGSKCQICGFTFKMANGRFYSEAAHITAISSRAKGIDVPENILILCPNHHKMLDYGVVEVISRDEVKIDGQIKRIQG